MVNNIIEYLRDVSKQKFQIDPIRDTDILLTYIALLFWGIVFVVVYLIQNFCKNQYLKFSMKVVLILICFQLILFDKQSLYNIDLQQKDLKQWNNFKQDINYLKNIQNQQNYILHVMSYNLRAAGIDINQNHWENRQNISADIILEQDIAADVVGTQEGFDFQLDYLIYYINSRDKQNQYSWFGHENEQNNKNFDSAIIYNQKTLKLISNETIWLSKFPKQKYSKLAESNLARTCTFGQFLHIKSNKTFLVFNLHLDHVQDSARQQQVEALIQYINEKKIEFNQANYMYYVVGDFNTMRHSLTYNKLEESDKVSVNDVWNFNITKYPHEDVKFTFHLYLGHHIESIFYKLPIQLLINIFSVFQPNEPFVRNPKDFHIDFIFIGSFNQTQLKQVLQNDLKMFMIWTRGKQLEFSDRVIYPSDHYPISSYITLQNF